MELFSVDMVVCSWEDKVFRILIMPTEWAKRSKAHSAGHNRNSEHFIQYKNQSSVTKHNEFN